MRTAQEYSNESGGGWQLGTTWGPHVMHPAGQIACDSTFAIVSKVPLTCANAYSNVLGVKRFGGLTTCSAKV
jgi:hypothetical protein